MIKPAQIPAKIIETILLTKTNLETSFSIKDPQMPDVAPISNDCIIRSIEIQTVV